MFNTDRALAFVRRLDFPRPCASEGEARAQEIVAEEIRALGLNPIRQEFPSWWMEPEGAVLALPDRAIEVHPAVPLPFLAAFPWMEGVGLEVEVSGTLADAAVPPRDPHTPLVALRETFQSDQAVLPWAAAQLLLLSPVHEFVPYAMIADPFVPSAYVPPEHASAVRKMVGQDATLSWRPKRCVRRFLNLVAGIRGRILPHEVVAVGAHLDSFPGTVGASDNAAGCAVVLEALRWFRRNPPDRTVRFLWFTGEELDQRGSRVFVAGLPPTEEVHLFVNSDGGFEVGTGPPWVRVSTESMKAWVQSWLESEITIEIRRSDGDELAFQARGIPTLRVAGRSRQSAHLPTDLPEGIDQDKLALMGKLTVEAAWRASQAAAPDRAGR